MTNLGGAPSISLESSVPRVRVNGLPIATAPKVEDLYAVLGKPTRVDSAGPVAPGLRNNQVHVYDDHGVRFLEHHHTLRVMELACSFACEDPVFAFTPRQPFAGQLLIDACAMPHGGPSAAFVERCPLLLDPQIGGGWSWKLGGFHLGLLCRGQRLPSGRRSKVRQVVDVSLSWPHDPWSKPGE